MNRITPLGAAICAILAVSIPPADAATPAGAAASTPASADTAAGPDADAAATVHEFARVQVTATRTERAIVDVAASVDVIDRERLDQTLAR